MRHLVLVGLILFGPVAAEGLSPGVYFPKFSCGGTTRRLKVVIAR
jgi:hypothetical protein